jgi:hypothetical protein
MEYIFIQRPGDREEIIERLKVFTKYAKAELVSEYNSTVKTGIAGVHAQALMIIALHNAFDIAFNKSPVKIVDYTVISLTGHIELVGENWEYSSNYNPA